MSKKIVPTKRDALLVIDVQNDFMPGGALAVPNGEEVINPINRLAKKFENVVETQDKHKPRHISFASRHPGKKPREIIELDYGEQVLWPDHCIEGSYGAMLHHKLWIPHVQLILSKGFHADSDSYSAFKEANGRLTGLAAYPDSRSIRRVFLVGLATDFCVAWSAVDAVHFGFTTFVIEDACRAIDVNDSLAIARNDMLEEGVTLIKSGDILEDDPSVPFRTPHVPLSEEEKKARLDSINDPDGE
jgi:nicotinamidase/pyrazinamidase